MNNKQKKELYKSIMESVSKTVKNKLNEDILVDNADKYISNENYDFYVNMYRYLSFIFDNLCKLSSGNPVLVKNLLLNGEIPYSHDTIDEFFSLGHITGLVIEEAIIKCLISYINGYDYPDDVVDIEDKIGKLGFDISEHISIEVGKDNKPKYDFKINYLGNKYSVLVKAVNTKNEGGNEMNAAIRKGVDLGIVVVYDFIGNDIIVNSIQLYIPDAEKTYNYIKTNKLGKSKLLLDSSKSFVTIGPRLINGKSYMGR